MDERCRFCGDAITWRLGEWEDDSGILEETCCRAPAEDAKHNPLSTLDFGNRDEVEEWLSA